MSVFKNCYVLSEVYKSADGPHHRLVAIYLNKESAIEEKLLLEFENESTYVIEPWPLES